MVDLSNITYRVAVIAENGKQYNIKEFITNLGWEENENEISMRSSFTSKNDKTSQGYLSNLIKPGCLIGIFASDGGSHKDIEVARGYVEEWKTVQKNTGSTLKCTCYDELKKLQASQDNRYYPSGTGTKSAIIGILDDWEIPQGEYKGPNASHGKKVFNNNYLSDIILDLLDDATKKGAEKCIIRASKGKTSVIPRGSNTDIYVFQSDNSKSIDQSISTAELVTRVKVVGKADDDGQRSVEATLNGLTKYGIRQKIYTRGSDESLEDAKSAGQEILNNEGAIKKEMQIQSPDVPFIRKGDVVYVISAFGKGFYYVKSIQHNAEQYNMTMEVEPVETETVKAENKTETKKSYKVGDVVYFKGGKHYSNSGKNAKCYDARAGKAKITLDPNCAGNAKVHPWHLIHTDKESNVYGWVDEGTFE